MEKFLNNNSKNIYIHIPFCVKKCNYCSFVSYSNIADYEEKYITALCKEIYGFKSDKTIDSVYIGGGTPNLLSITNLEKIISALNENFIFANDIEFTMEFNPKLSDISYLKSVKSMGINRVSLGAQSFNDDILKVLGRIHSAQDTLNMIEYINAAGITNYSLDLIYGVFGQKLQDVEHDLNIIKRISPTHVSTYGLKIESQTPFFFYPKDNLPDEDLCADMYLLISDILRHAGYEHYEISNFARTNHISKHNMAYWQNKEYYGFGVSAHGYLNKIRYKNPDTLSAYIENPMEKEIISVNTKDDILEEKIFLGLRTSDGIDFPELKKTFGVDIFAKNKDFIEKILSGGHAVLDGNRLFLTEKGFLISNYIMSELIS